MQKISYFLVLTLILISFSCSDNLTDSPLQSDNNIYINPNTELLKSQVIDGATGGTISIDTTIVNSNNDTIQISGSLEIDPLSFDGIKNIQIIPNYSNASIQFYPEMQFKKDLKFNFLFKGIDLEKADLLGATNLNFVYIKDNGEIESVVYTNCQIIGNEKFLKVTSARLSHFSRYQFIR